MLAEVAKRGKRKKNVKNVLFRDGQVTSKLDDTPVILCCFSLARSFFPPTALSIGLTDVVNELISEKLIVIVPTVDSQKECIQ